MQAAGVDDLARVPGISRALAERIFADAPLTAGSRRGAVESRVDARVLARRRRHDAVQRPHSAHVAADRADSRCSWPSTTCRTAWLTPATQNWTAMWIFAAAAITDWLDGWLARRWGVTTAFGAFLDPVADKLMVAAALIVLVWLGRAESYLAIIIIGREIAISALREWMAELGQTQERRRRLHRQAEDRRADDGDHRAAAARAADPGHSDAADRHRRAVDRRDPDAVVDVPLPAARRAAPAAATAATDDRFPRGGNPASLIFLNPSPPRRPLRADWRCAARRTPGDLRLASTGRLK